jgi:hypothetical protein
MLSFSKHALQRAAQRNLRDVDLEVILTLGCEVADGYLMRDSDCRAAERELKRALQQVRRLRGKRLVIKDGKIVTVFHATDREVRRILRRSEERSIAA